MNTFTASEVREKAAAFCDPCIMGVHTTGQMLAAYADRLEADEMAQVQRGVWVLVPREPTDGMLQAAEDAVNAASNCESTTDDLSAIAYKAALAAAPQQAAEPVAFRYLMRLSGNSYAWTRWLDIGDKNQYETGGCVVEYAYRYRQPAQDVKDAARFRWLAQYPNLFTVNDLLRADQYTTLTRACDSLMSNAAMAKESGR